MAYDTVWLFGVCAVYALLAWVLSRITRYDDDET